MEECKLAKSRRLFQEYLANTPKDVLKKQADKWNEIDKRIKQNRKMEQQVILVMGCPTSDFKTIVDIAIEKLGSYDRATIVAPEVIYRHPKAIIQFVRDIVAAKLPCLIITYSDYVAKEINNLVMLGYNEQILAGNIFKGYDGFVYLDKHVLPKDELKAYIFDNGLFNEMVEVTEWGISKSAFDDEIVSIDKTANYLAQQMVIKDGSNNEKTAS